MKFAGLFTHAVLLGLLPLSVCKDAASTCKDADKTKLQSAFNRPNLECARDLVNECDRTKVKKYCPFTCGDCDDAEGAKEYCDDADEAKMKLIAKDYPRLKGQTCASLKTRCDSEYMDGLIAHICPATCGSCCKDSPEKTLLEHFGSKVTCRELEREGRCQTNDDVKELCPVTCEQDCFMEEFEDEEGNLQDVNCHVDADGEKLAEVFNKPNERGLTCSQFKHSCDKEDVSLYCPVACGIICQSVPKNAAGSSSSGTTTIIIVSVITGGVVVSVIVMALAYVWVGRGSAAAADVEMAVQPQMMVPPMHAANDSNLGGRQCMPQARVCGTGFGVFDEATKVSMPEAYPTAATIVHASVPTASAKYHD